MDDYNHMMETECPDVSYQSEMMTGMNETTVNNDSTSQPPDGQNETSTPQPVTNNNSNECATKLDDDQSVSASTDDTSIRKTDTNEQSNDKFGDAMDECENVENSKNAEEKTETTELTDTKETKETIETTENTENTENTNEETKTDQNPPNNDDDNDDTNSSTPKLLRKEKKEEEIDLNQCRICMSSSNLMDIFRIGEKTSFRICDLIMKLAPAVKISERDFLPHSVCGVCVERVEAAYELRIQCEETDTELRSKLKRSKKTRRTPAEFVLIDCAESSSDSDDDQKSDDEFQLSEESEESSETDTDSSYDEKKKKSTNQRGWKRQMPIKRANPVPYQPPPPAKKLQKSGVVYIKAQNSDDDSRMAKTTATVQPVKRLPAKPSPNRLSFRCDICNRTCSTADALVQHRRTHAEEKCNICSAAFKNRTVLFQHMQRHKEDPDRVCQKCQRVFGTKVECQRHVHMAHPETVACKQCKRYFPNKTQLDAHKCIAERKVAVDADTVTMAKRKPDNDTSSSGRDLFKSVAPPTTTYWSDSFSD